MVSVGNPYVLSPAQYRTIKKTALDIIRNKTVGRKLLPLDPEASPGTQEMESTKYIKPESNAKIIAKGGEYDIFEPTEQKSRVKIRKLGKAFVVTDEDLDTSRATGKGLDKRGIELATEMIVEDEESFIFSGYAPMNEPGLVDLVPEENKVDALAPWDTDMLEPYEDFRKTIGVLSENNFVPKVAVFNNKDFANIFKEDSFGKTYFNKLVENFSISKDNYLMTTGMPSGSILLMDIGPQIADFKEVERVNPRDPVRDTRDRQQINVREQIGKEVYRPEALALIENMMTEE